MGKRKPQHGKGGKRKSHWHQGSGQADEWERTMALWPEAPLTNADPTVGEPTKLRQSARDNPRRRMGAK